LEQGFGPQSKVMTSPSKAPVAGDALTFFRMKH